MLAEALAVTSASVRSRSKRCPKCGTVKKSGKSNCCARGGAWFQKCGHDGDSKSDHTWVEGIYTCSEFADSPLLVEAGAQASGEEINAHLLSTTWPRNTVKQHINIDPLSSASDAGNWDCTEHIELGEIFTYASVSFFVLCFHV